MIKVTCCLLFALIFISKISFKILGGVPRTLHPLIFQYGLHPYLNILFQYILCIIVLLFWLKSTNKFRTFSKFYLFMLMTTIIGLSIQTILQFTVSVTSITFTSSFFGLVMAATLLFIYGIVLPSLITPKYFIKTTLYINIPIIILSLFFIPFFWIQMQKGGRFIGLYKHIPHLVTASSICFMFQYSLFLKKFNYIKTRQKVFSGFLITIFLSASILTFTKATFLSLILFSFLAPLFLGPNNHQFNLFKITILLCSISIIIFLGSSITSKIIEYSSGKSTIGFRTAQNGIESRTEEIYRGLDILKKSPILGLGIMYKYANSKNNNIEVDGYNSFKDPHNFFISAGVIGGIPLMVFSFIAFLAMFIASSKALLSSQFEKRLFGLIILCHLPVFFIYHLHFSMGGVADRVYYLLLGYLAKKENLEVI